MLRRIFLPQMQDCRKLHNKELCMYLLPYSIKTIQSRRERALRSVWNAQFGREILT